MDLKHPLKCINFCGLLTGTWSGEEGIQLQRISAYSDILPSLNISVTVSFQNHVYAFWQAGSLDPAPSSVWKTTTHFSEKWPNHLELRLPEIYIYSPCWEYVTVERLIEEEEKKKKERRKKSKETDFILPTTTSTWTGLGPMPWS